MEALEILVVFLSIFLAIFLILAIALVFELLKIARKLEDMTDRANSFVSGFGDTVIELFKKSITPSVIASALFQFTRKARRASDKANKKEE